MYYLIIVENSYLSLLRPMGYLIVHDGYIDDILTGMALIRILSAERYSIHISSCAFRDGL